MIRLFRVIQDPEKAEKLVWLLERTPFSRAEFELAYKPAKDDVEAVRRTIVRSFMGFGSDGTAGVYPTGFRRNVTNAGKFPASEWKSYPKALRRTIDRSEEHTSELQSLMRISYAVFCLKKKNNIKQIESTTRHNNRYNR